MDALKKILFHFKAHQDEYVDLYGGKYVVITSDFKTAGVFDTREDARRFLHTLKPGEAAYYPAIPGEKAYTIYL